MVLDSTARQECNTSAQNTLSCGCSCAVALHLHLTITVSHNQERRRCVPLRCKSRTTTTSDAQQCHGEVGTRCSNRLLAHLASAAALSLPRGLEASGPVLSIAPALSTPLKCSMVRAMPSRTCTFGDQPSSCSSNVVITVEKHQQQRQQRMDDEQ